MFAIATHTHHFAQRRSAAPLIGRTPHSIRSRRDRHGKTNKTRVADAIMENVELRQLSAVTPTTLERNIHKNAESAQFVLAISKLHTQHHQQRLPRSRTHVCTPPLADQPRISGRRRREQSIDQYDECWFH